MHDTGWGPLVRSNGRTALMTSMCAFVMFPASELREIGGVTIVRYLYLAKATANQASIPCKETSQPAWVISLRGRSDEDPTYRKPSPCPTKRINSDDGSQRPWRVALVTVTYNSAPVLDDFLASLDRQTSTDWTLVAVDNASTDATREMLSKWRGPLHLIANDANLGFAAATNQGIVWARDQVSTRSCCSTTTRCSTGISSPGRWNFRRAMVLN
jgi:hypothetical protein